MRRAAAVAVTVALLLGLTACGGSAQHVRDICGDVTTGTAALDRYDPATPRTAVMLAIGRFDLVEQAVSKARETGLPDDAAATLRAAWLEPAVASMAPWQSRLQALRDAVASGDGTRVDDALSAALALGTTGVDTTALRTAGYDACATAFTAPTLDAVTG